MKGFFLHLPVLLQEVMEYLKLAPGDTVLDATLGGGGHAAQCLKKIGPKGKLIAVDRDPEAIENAKESLSGFKNRIVWVNDNFRNMGDILRLAGVDKVNGAIFDLGVSSHQIDTAERGFSFLKDGPLDMRFSDTQDISACSVVNSFSKDELAEIISEYGEERHAGLVAGGIIRARAKKRIETTKELTEVILAAVGRKYRKVRLHPAARTFQALRIYVNNELDSAKVGVRETIGALATGARICVISFHSLEDRIIKNLFKDAAREEKVKIITKKPISPGRDEIRTNSRARSAKLRCAERV